MVCPPPLPGASVKRLCCALSALKTTSDVSVVKQTHNRSSRKTLTFLLGVDEDDVLVLGFVLCVQQMQRTLQLLDFLQREEALLW